MTIESMIYNQHIKCNNFAKIYVDGNANINVLYTLKHVIRYIMRTAVCLS